MKRKQSCNTCGKVYTATSLYRSLEDHSKICYNCNRDENKERNKRKLKLISKKNEGLTDFIRSSRKSRRVSRMLKYGVKLIRGEDEL